MINLHASFIGTCDLWMCSQTSESEFLLVILLVTFIHKDLWYGKLVPSSHQRSKFSHTILCTFSRGNNWIWKSIPISDCLREKWVLVNVRSCSRGLKSPCVMISIAPNWQEKIICWNVGSTFVKKNQSTVFPPFLERIPSLFFFQYSSHFSQVQCSNC